MFDKLGKGVPQAVLNAILGSPTLLKISATNGKSMPGPASSKEDDFSLVAFSDVPLPGETPKPSPKPLTPVAARGSVVKPKPKEGRVISADSIPEKDTIGDPSVQINGRREAAVLAKDGTLYVLVGNGDQAKLREVGSVRADGSYRLLDGREGSIFANEDVALGLGYNMPHNHFAGDLGKALKKNFEARAKENTQAYADRLRKAIADKKFVDPNGKPITGAGIKAVILEDTKDVEDGVRTRWDHAGQVAEMLDNKDVGIAPGVSSRGMTPPLAKSGPINFRNRMYPIEKAMKAREKELSEARDGKPVSPEELQADPTVKSLQTRLDAIRAEQVREKEMLNKNPERLGAHLRQVLADGIDKFSDGVEAIMKRNDPAERLINISDGASAASLFQYLQGHLQGPERDRYPQLTREILRFRQDGDTENQAIMRYIRHALDGGREDEKALERWRDISRKAAESGRVIVIASSNTAPDASLDPILPGWSFNDLAKSSHVLRTATANAQGTPDNNADDTIAFHSGRGDGRWNPTVAIPADDLETPIMRRFSRINGGSSVAAPRLSGVVALMLQMNPNLSFDDIQSILREAATPNRRYTERDQGAGFLDPVRALEITQARMRRRE